MAPVGGEVLSSWLPSTASMSPDLGMFSLLVLIIISVYFTSLCSNCGRRSFDMQEPEVPETPSALIKVAKLEEGIAPSAQVNPVFQEMKGDALEKGVPTDQSSEDEGGPWFTPWRSHLGSQKDPEGDEDHAANTDTPANQLLARLQASSESTQEWVNRKHTAHPPPASPAPALHPGVEE